MFRSLIHQIYLLGVRIANIGVTDELDFHEKKKVQVINICITTGVIPKVFFGSLNFFQDKIILGCINLAMLTGGILILWMHHRHKYPLARLILIFSASLLFTASAVLYRNGGEYYLMANLIIMVIFFREKKFLIVSSIANCLLFIGVKIFLQYSHFTYDTVPFSRVVFNMLWTLGMMVLGLWFFKTEQFNYQRTIEDKNRELQKINRSKEKIFSIIAHDLRSPIAQLKGSLELVNRDYISPEQFHEITGRLASQVDHLHNSMDNLLRWSLSQLQGITAKPERTHLATIIEQKLKLYQQRMDEKQLRLVAEDIDYVIWVDPDHLLVVLRNLLSNAIKYSYPASTVAISCHADNREVTICISDSGIGMNRHQLSTIFQADIIESKPGTSNERGTGLGLKLCREFVEKNNGRIHAESRENSGSTFYISLPKAV